MTHMTALVGTLIILGDLVLLGAVRGNIEPFGSDSGMTLTGASRIRYGIFGVALMLVGAVLGLRYLA